MKRKVSKKYIITIEEFMENYLGKVYNGNSKLTHNEMYIYLKSKNMGIPRRVAFKCIKDEDILNGNILYVKDKENKIIVYRNPKHIDLKILLNELKSEKSKRNSMIARRTYLKSIEYVQLSNGCVIKEEDLEENQVRCIDNRTKKLINRDGYKMRGVY